MTSTPPRVGDRFPTAREPVITIDGPAGAGKTTVARELAWRLGFRLVDTGAMYRAVALRVAEVAVDVKEGDALRALLDETVVELRKDRVFVNDCDVSEAIRAPEIGELTSRLTTLAPVREKVTPIQRRLADCGGAVLEGRDTGSVVYPEAEVKFYLDASEEARAQRRLRDLEGRGIPRRLKEVRDEIARRDRQDRGRDLAPLVIPEGAVVIDSTTLSIDQVVEMMQKEVERIRCSTRRSS